MSPELAAPLMDDDGFVTVVTTVSQERFMAHRGHGRTTEGADDEHDLVHAQAFSFGLPYDATTRILAVQDDDFVVSYSTNIRTQL